MLRALFTLAPFALVGCLAHTGDEGMYIYNNTAASGTTCMLTGDPGQPFFSGGMISTLSTSGYFITPLIRSRITALAGNDEASRTIELRGAHVSTGTTTADILFSGSLLPEGSVNVGFELPIATASYTATITPFGKLAGGDITGQPFTYRVTVCTSTTGGCVVDDRGLCGNRCSNDATLACNLPADCGGGSCSTSMVPCTTTAQCGAAGGTCGFPYTCGPAGITPRPGNPCNPYQDGIVDCCHNATGLVCPAM